MIYIALLRGINVGGHRKIKMTDLRASIERIVLSPVQTYIQSGNIIFDSEYEEEAIRQQLEEKIEYDYGYDLDVVLRKLTELNDIMNHCPFSKENIDTAMKTAKGKPLSVGLLQQMPTTEGIEKIRYYESNKEAYRVEGRNVYLLFYDSIRHSKLANQLHQLGSPVTIRNWQTLQKIETMAEDMIDKSST